LFKDRAGSRTELVQEQSLFKNRADLRPYGKVGWRRRQWQLSWRLRWWVKRYGDWKYARSECSTQGGRRDGELRSRREEDEGSVKDGWWRQRPRRARVQAAVAARRKRRQAEAVLVRLVERWVQDSE
jgi:hypothetical protein